MFLFSFYYASSYCIFYKHTLSFIILEDPKKSGGQEAELSLTGIGQRGYHFSHGRLPSHTRQTVIVREQKPGQMENKKRLTENEHHMCVFQQNVQVI